MKIDFRWLITKEWDPVRCQHHRVLQYRIMDMKKWGEWKNVREEEQFFQTLNTNIN